MTKDITGLIAWLAGGAILYSAELEPAGQEVSLLVLGLLTFGFDALRVTPWGNTASRVAPLPALALLLHGQTGFLVASAALFFGGLLVCLAGRNKARILGDLFRTLGPLGSAGAASLPLPEPIPAFMLITVFSILSLALEPRRYTLRLTLGMLFCAPWMALACYEMSREAPWTLVLVIPILFGLSSGRDDTFPLLRKLRHALRLTQEQAKAQSEKARRFQNLLRAANLMARTLKPEALRHALKQATERTGMTEVQVYLPGEKWPVGGGVPLLDGRAQLTYSGTPDASQKDQLEILARVFSTCWENAELHQRVLEALEETKRSQAQLVESSRLAAMGLMAAGVAHEVNTPLGAIQISNELAQKCLQKKPEAVSKHLQSIDRATERAQKAVERILYYAKPMGEEEKETFTVSEVVDDALALLSHRIERAKSSVQTEVPEHIHLTGERQAFYTLIFNLVLNALEATGPDKEGSVWLRVGETKDRIVMEVEDSGEGVPQSIRPHIFEPFYTTRPSGEGTGLGLHLARSAAELFGGRLDLVPSRTQGAIFRAEFPKKEPG